MSGHSVAVKRPSWDPTALVVANVAGRALISDAFVLAEWRNDPWPGFDLGEGGWVRTKRHTYVPGIWNAHHGAATRTYDATRARDVLRRTLKKNPPAECIPVEKGTQVRCLQPDGDWTIAQHFVGLDDPLYVSPEKLAQLAWLIDGEPEEWRAIHPHKPVHAFTGRGRWLGCVMPLRLTEEADRDR